MAKAKGDERRLDPGQSYRSAMRDLIAERWGKVWEAVPVALAGEDIEGVHDVRVASRRLRAAMDVAVGCFPIGWYAPLHRTAKAITGALGEVRDRDVLLEHLREERESAPAAERAGLDRLIARVERERVAARVKMEAYLAGLEAAGVPAEAARRFGPAAGPPPPAPPRGQGTARDLGLLPDSTAKASPDGDGVPATSGSAGESSRPSARPRRRTGRPAPPAGDGTGGVDGATAGEV